MADSSNEDLGMSDKKTSRSPSPPPIADDRDQSPSRSRSPQPAAASPPARERSASQSKSRSRSASRRVSSRSRSLSGGAESGDGEARRDGRRGVRRSRSRSRGGRRRKGRSGSRERRGRDRSPATRPATDDYKPPERWLRNLFEDGLKEALGTTSLPINVSKINDCMRRLDPTYTIGESDFPSFSLLCYWFEDNEGLLVLGKEGDSVVMVASKLEGEVTKREVPRRPPRTGKSRSGHRRRGRSPPRGLRRGDSGRRRGGNGGGKRLTRSPSPGRFDGRTRRGDDRLAQRGRFDDRWANGHPDDRWQMD